MKNANDFTAQMRRRIIRAENRIKLARTDAEYLDDAYTIAATQKLLAAFDEEGR